MAPYSATRVIFALYIQGKLTRKKCLSYSELGRLLSIISIHASFLLNCGQSARKWPLPCGTTRVLSSGYELDLGGRTRRPLRAPRCGTAFSQRLCQRPINAVLTHNSLCTLAFVAYASCVQITIKHWPALLDSAAASAADHDHLKLT
jgi:hypothetical protein